MTAMPDVRENVVYARSLPEGVGVRAIDEENRSATFVASTEKPVETWEGMEVLRMKGLDLTRYKRNQVVIDSHDRWSVTNIVGRAEVKVVKRELLATVYFAETELGEQAWQLVKTGFLRALSVAFIVRESHRLEEGESDGRGESRVEGPMIIVTEWELFEISVVAVPADADALRRSLRVRGETTELLERLVAEAVARERKDKENRAMTKEDKKAEDAKGKEQPKAEDQPKGDEPVDARAAVLTVTDKTVLTDVERRARDIRAIAPESLHELAEQCILEGDDLEAARKRLLQAMTEREKPVGTTEPQPVEVTGDGRAKARSADGEVGEEHLTREDNQKVLLRSLLG